MSDSPRDPAHPTAAGGPPLPRGLPDSHRAFLEGAVRTLESEPALLGVAVGGSVAAGRADPWSDLDLVLLTADEALPADVDRRMGIARRLGPLLTGFTGEHVGDPRLLICLYGPPLLHVDLKFQTPAQFEQRAEDPVVLFEQGGAVSDVVARTTAAFPAPGLQWIEDRFWIWVHYGATKLRRGELLEAWSFLGFVQQTVCGPLAHVANGTRPQGVRRAEELPPEDVAALRALCVPCEGAAIRTGMFAAVAHYRSLRDRLSDGRLERREDAERESVAYLEAT